MNRATLFLRDGKVFVQREHLSKQPSGNAAQRKKQLRQGWKPDWVNSMQPHVFDGVSKATFGIDAQIEFLPFGDLSPPPEISAALAIARAI